MAGILTPPSTGDAPAPRPATPVPSAGTAQPNTLSMNNPLANMSAVNPTATPPMHGNQAVNEALMQAFRPVVPDQINSLLGPAIGAIQAHTNPIAFYQPRQAAPVSTVRGSS